MAELSNNPKPAKLAASAVTPSRFTSWRDHFAAERRWVADTFTGERMIDFLKQLAWVVPLTLLIWVYAEREQVTKEQNETIPFELISADPNRLVTLKPPQDSNVVVELEGPRARVQDVLTRLRGGAYPQGLRIQVDPALEPNRDHQLRTITLIGNNELFRHNGITVTRTQPDSINVTVDQIVEREARVEPAPGTLNLVEGTKFEPATVKVRGPKSALDPEGDNSKPLVAYAHFPASLLQQPGPRQAEGLDLSLPPPLAKDTRIAITPSTVDAVFQVRAADARWVMPAMTISLDVPANVIEKNKVEHEPSLPDVTLIGPKDVLDQLREGKLPVTPYAQLKVTRDDVGRGEQQRTLRFQDLPSGVRVDAKDQQRTITFRVVPRDVEQ